MKKEIKNYEKITEIILIILTFISLIINPLVFTNALYSCSYETVNLNNLVITPFFNIILWIDNISIYIVSIFYIISAMESKQNVRIKIIFSIFSILTTTCVMTLIINLIASIFGIF